jgi:hypothetical protein
MSRFVRILLLAAVTLVVASPAAGTASAKSLDDDLARLWTTVLQTPSAQNSFGTGGQAYACFDLGGGTVAPFAPAGVKSCTVTPGTALFVTANSVECSTFEGTPQPMLRDCSRQGDVNVAPSVTVDGALVPVTEAETGLLNIVLPAGNLFELPAGTQGYSYGHGWVTRLSPLSSGTHKIVITVVSRTGKVTVIKTKIKVKSGS